MDKKYLHKSSKNKKVFGVCGGLAEYFDCDPTLIRLIWGISILGYGFGAAAYIVAAFILPTDNETN